MSEIAPVILAVLLWWFGTGLVLALDSLPQRTFRWSMLAATVLLVAALYGLFLTASDPTPRGAYLAFTFGLIVWAWLELGFLTGTVTGPRKSPCPAGCSGPAHFGHAVQAILYHELAIILAAGAIAALTWNAPNRVGLATFAILWVMRQSAKLNLHFGVPNLSDGLLPEHLAYLKSFFRRRPMNLLFPVSITAATTLTAMLVQRALDAPPGSFEWTAYALLAALSGLAVLEHWLLVLPLPVEALWAWGTSRRESRSRPSARDHAPLESAAVRSAGDLS
ncbi:MAG TPA: putative photosynthetic complex assembly protein PuhE [Steroidobacteraceae bacterium]|nr:putative photosynthetic complex assembly protein PuhE [Steroidobacteraceae bacterium]